MTKADLHEKLKASQTKEVKCRDCGKDFVTVGLLINDRPRCPKCLDKAEWSLRCEDLTNEIRQKVIEHHSLMRKLLDAKSEEILRLKLTLADLTEEVKKRQEKLDEVTEELRQSQLDFLGISQRAGKMENVIKDLKEKLRAERRVVGQEDQ